MTYLPRVQAKKLLAGKLVDFMENDLDNLGPYLEHVGFDVGALKQTSDLLPACVEHYRFGQGTYDTHRAARRSCSV